MDHFQVRGARRWSGALLSGVRVGIFGSSFDPPHNEHVALAEAARDQLSLDRVIVVPTGDPYHKPGPGRASAATRLEMASAAFAGQAGVEVSAVEMERAGPSYTVDTLEAMAGRFPGAELWLILGSDAAAGLSGWHRAPRVTELARIAVVPRNGDGRTAFGPELEQARTEGLLRAIEFAGTEVSSSQIRSLIKAKSPWRHLVSADVARIIDNEGLYAD